MILLYTVASPVTKFTAVSPRVSGIYTYIVSSEVDRAGQKVEPFLLRLPLSTEVRIPLGGLYGTVPELLFEKKELIPMLQQLLISYHT